VTPGVLIIGWDIENKMKLADRLRGSGVELAQADVQQCPSVPPLLELWSHHQTICYTINELVCKIYNKSPRVSGRHSPGIVPSSWTVCCCIVLSTRSQESVYDSLTAATLIQYGVAKHDSLVVSGDKYFDYQLM